MLKWYKRNGEGKSYEETVCEWYNSMSPRNLEEAQNDEDFFVADEDRRSLGRISLCQYIVRAAEAFRVQNASYKQWDWENGFVSVVLS